MLFDKLKNDCLQIINKFGESEKRYNCFWDVASKNDAGVVE